MKKIRTEGVRFDGPADFMPDAQTMVQYAEELQDNMGEWALLGRTKSMGSAGQRAYAIRQGTQPGFDPAGSFEAEGKTLFGEYRVYARYVGPR